jgi:hypothetical protein
LGARVGNGVSAIELSSGISVNDGNFHHACLTAEPDGDGNTTVKLYLDGVLKNTKTLSGSPYSTGSGARVTIAKWRNYGFFPGIIDEVQIYNRSLSADEVADQYAKGFTRYESTTPIVTIMGNLTLNGMKSTWGYFDEIKCFADKLTIYGGASFKVFNSFESRIYIELFSYYGNYYSLPIPQFLSQSYAKQQIERYLRANYVDPLQILTTPTGTLWTITIIVILLIVVIPPTRKILYRYAKWFR